MSRGFGPFKPRVVFPRGWYFKPVQVNRASNTRRYMYHTTRAYGAAPPQVVHRLFRPTVARLAVHQNVSSRGTQRKPFFKNFVVTKAVIPTNTVAPVASGTPTNGQLLSTTNGTWTGTATVTVGSGYQWQTASDVGFTTAVADIGGATASTYLLTAGEVGLYVRCIVQATNVAAIGLGYSNALGPVAP